MNCSYDAYRVFYYVARCRNFTHAAEALYSSQPNVTRTIRQLEQSLGCTLFIRSNRGVTLTPEGEKLFAHVEAAHTHMEAAERELSLDRTMQQGIVSISVSENALHCFLLPVLRRFRQRYPGVRIRISSHATLQAVAALHDHLTDLAIVTTPVSPLGAMQQTNLCQLHEIAICGPSYRALCGRTLPLSELSAYPLIFLNKKSMTYQFYASFFAEHNVALSADIEAASSSQILLMVRSDLGIGFLPEEFLRELPEDNAVFRLKLAQPIAPRYVCMLRREAEPLSLAAAELEAMLLAARDESCQKC